MDTNPKQKWDLTPSDKMDCSPHCSQEDPEQPKSWEEECLESLTVEVAYYRSNPAALEQETVLWGKALNEAETKRSDIGVQMAEATLKQSEQRQKLKSISEKKQKCVENLRLNGEPMQRRYFSYESFTTYITERNSELLAKNKELEDVQKRRQQVNNEASALCSQGYPLDSDPLLQLAANDYDLLTREHELNMEREVILDKIQISHDNVNPVFPDAGKLANEEHKLKKKLEILSSEENCLQNKLDQLAKLLKEQKKNLKMAVTTETTSNKNFAKLIFIKSLIVMEEREKVMLEAADMDVCLTRDI